MRCGHCGNKSPFEVKSLYSYAGGKWRLLQCMACSKPTLDYIHVLFDQASSTTYDSEPKMLYPVAKTSLTNLPPMIEKEYEEALIVRNISPVACAVLARRTLEAVCDYEKAEGRALMDKVNYLLKLDRIPPLVGEMAQLGRMIGNLGAHFAEEKVTEEDVTTMLDFVETILEYLYVAPAKVDAVKARLKKTP
jgi:hypothetical protein